MATAEMPADRTVSYSRQYRRCGKAGCQVCAPGQPGHGPYWYAYWREGGRTRSRYLGRTPPPEALLDVGQTEDAPSRAPRQSLRVRTLGGFAVRLDEETLPADWGGRSVAALFKCLLGAPDHRLHRERLVDLLWPDAEPTRGAANLRTAVHRLRRALRDSEGNAGYLHYDGEVLALTPGAGDPYWLDSDVFETATRAARAGSDPAACRAALALYGGEYLPDDPYAEWAVQRREELRAAHMALLLHLATLCARDGQSEEAARHLRSVLEADPCHEEAALALMRLYAAMGRSAQALRAYRRLAAALREELALEPEAETRALYRTLLARRQAAPETPPPDPPVPSNLPEPLTSFIGRRRELAALRALLLPGAAGAGTAEDTPVPCRLLTLTGVGGCGKTRLALQVADEMLEDFPDGVWLVELAALREPALVGQAVARVLGLREETGRPLLETLKAALRSRRMLLLLDNCEHLLDGCAALATVLLAHCPALRILATSREPLGIGGERVWRVPPLSLPEEQPTLPARLLEAEAARLFLDRARAQLPDLALTEANAGAVAAICRRLDGLPLAIELAAARIRLLSVEQIAARLGQRLALLTGGPRRATARQRTLRGALDWSHDLLLPDEQILFRRLAVFVGGWTLEAAEAVCALTPVPEFANTQRIPASCATRTRRGERGEDDPRGPGTSSWGREENGALPLVHGERGLGGEGLSVLDCLASLADKCMVRREAGAEWSEASHEAAEAPRFVMLETIREYGLERLAASGELGAVAERHALYYLELAEASNAAARSPGEAAWLTRLEVDHDNPRAALAWARSAKRTEVWLRLAGALSWFWNRHGHLSEGRRWLDAALAAPGSVPPAVRAAALGGAGILAQLQGDYPHAARCHEESLVLWRALGDRRGIARALNSLGNVAWGRNDFGSAMALYEECLALRREGGDEQEIAALLNNLALVASARSEFTRAATLYDECLALLRARGDAYSIAVALMNLGICLQAQDKHEDAARCYDESLALCRAHGLRQIMVRVLSWLGILALDQGGHERAAALFDECRALAVDLGDMEEVVKAKHYAGVLAIARGEYTQAAALFQECVRERYARGQWYGVAANLERLAQVACLVGMYGPAAVLFGCAEARREAVSSPLSPREHRVFAPILCELRGRLGEPAFAAAWSDGRSMLIEAAITIAEGIAPCAGLSP